MPRLLSGSLFNHSNSPNVSYELDVATDSIRYRTVSDVEEGQELCIYYGPQLWFEDVTSSNQERNDHENDTPILPTLMDEPEELDDQDTLNPDEILPEDELPFVKFKPPPEEECLASVRTGPVLPA